MRFHSGMARFAKLGVAARAGIVASIIIAPMTTLIGSEDMQAQVSSARIRATGRCFAPLIERENRTGVPIVVADPMAGGRCLDAGDAAAAAEARQWMLFIAGRAALSVLALWVVGIVVLRTGRWIGQGQKA